MIDSIAGADSSAIIYSIAETAKANNLKPYDYFEYLLTDDVIAEKVGLELATVKELREETK